MNRAALKTAVRLMVQQLGGLDAAKSCTRVGTSNLAEYASVHHPARHAPIDVVLDLELIAGEPHVTAALARLQGYRLEPIAPVNSGDVVSPAQRLVRSTADLAAQLLDALADNTITTGERDALLDVAAQARAAADAVLSALQATRDGRA